VNRLADVWRKIKEAFSPYLEMERAIKEVESWDGSASRWPSTEAYCDDCLINVNQSSDPDEWTQDHCMLPIREPGDSDDTYVKQAVYAAAAGHGITQVKRPDDVPQDEWEAAVRAAANKIIAAYNEMDETAPAAVYELAGKEPPEEARAMSIDQVYEQLYLKTSGTDMWPYNLYTDDDGSMYAIMVGAGKLYRVPLTVTSGELTVGEAEEVEIQHVPVQRGASLQIYRQEDGRYRWAAIACTAILNRDGEIDSSELFDKLVERFEEPIPLDFFHQDIFLGDVEFVARDGYTLVASGLFSDDEVGRAAAETVAEDPDEWGLSIQYKPLAPPDFIEVAEGVKFPVWRDGELRRVALLPKDRASAWYTTINVMRGETMKAEILEALKRLIGEERALALAGQVDEVNERVANDGLIAREQETEDAPEPEPEPEAEPEATEPPSEVEVIRQMREQQREIQETVKALAEGLHAFVADVTERLQKLERSEQERREAWLADLPTPHVRAVVRPRREPEPAEEDEDISEHVRKVLASKAIMRED